MTEFDAEALRANLPEVQTSLRRVLASDHLSPAGAALADALGDKALCGRDAEAAHDVAAFRVLGDDGKWRSAAVALFKVKRLGAREGLALRVGARRVDTVRLACVRFMLRERRAAE